MYPRNKRKIKPGELLKAHRYRVGDVARWIGIETHVLRFWETEFRHELGAIERTKAGQRIYSRVQMVKLYTIKELLYTELYTIAGAKRQLGLAAERAKSA